MVLSRALNAAHWTSVGSDSSVTAVAGSMARAQASGKFTLSAERGFEDSGTGLCLSDQLLYLFSCKCVQ